MRRLFKYIILGLLFTSCNNTGSEIYGTMIVAGVRSANYGNLLTHHSYKYCITIKGTSLNGKYYETYFLYTNNVYSVGDTILNIK